MLTRESIYVILYSLPVYQLLFYTVQVITLKRSSPARRYLGLMLLSMTGFLIVNAVYHLGYDDQMKWLYYFFVPVLLTLLPVFYLYIVSLAKENRDTDSRTRLILFLPPIIIFILNLVLYRALPSPEKIVFLKNGFQSAGESAPAVLSSVMLHWSGIAGLLAIQLVLAIFSIYKVLRKEAEQMHLEPGHLTYLQFPWIAIISACVMMFLVAGSLLNLFGPAKGMLPAVLFNSLMLICGGFTGYYGMKQDALMDQVSKVGSLSAENIKAEVVAQPDEEGYPDIAAHPGFITEEETSEIVKDLDEIMQKGKPYLDPKFSLHDLCQLMNVSRRKLTYVINEVMQKNFYGVINDYRIKESIRLLDSKIGHEYKMDSISEMVGFKSKSSFYACFKKYTGITPSEYRLKNAGKSKASR